MKFYLVTRPAFRGTVLPVHYYTFAEDELQAIKKGEDRWDACDATAVALEITGDALSELIISVDGYFSYFV